MELKNKNRRGATLAELAVVIAVVAIVAVMVTSFIVMLDGSRDLSEMKLEALQDIRLAESVIEGYIEDAVTPDSEGRKGFSTYSSNRLIGMNGKILEFYAGVLHLGNTDIELTTVESITFDNLLGEDPTADDYLSKVNSSDNIFYCTITYDIGGTEFDYTFCVNPYAGENIGG